MMDHDTVTSLLTPPVSIPPPRSFSRPSFPQQSPPPPHLNPPPFPPPKCSPPGSPPRSSCPSPTLDILSAASSPLSTPPCSPQLDAVDASGFDVSDILLSGMDLEGLFGGRTMTPPPEMLTSLGAMVAAAPLDMPYSEADNDMLSFVSSDEAVPYLPPMPVAVSAMAVPSAAEAKAPKRRRKSSPATVRSAPVPKVAAAATNKRDSHNVSERHRRAELKKSFEMLRKQVPEIADTPKAHTGQILRVTISYVNALRREEQQHMAAKAALAQENARLRALIAKRRA